MLIITTLCLLLITAHLLGRLALRCGQPELLGHMAAGVLLGPAVLNVVQTNSALNHCADVSVFIVVVSAGLEMRLRDVARFFGGRGLAALLPGIVLPAAMGFGLATWFGFGVLAATVMSLCTAVTALPVALRILGDFKLLNTPLAQFTIAGALLADVLVLLVLGVLASKTDSSLTSIGMLLGTGLAKVAALLALLGVAAWLYRLALQHLQLAVLHSGLALAVILGLSAAAHVLGLHFAIGAFLGALTVADCLPADNDKDQPATAWRFKLNRMSTLIFAPFFLATQGTHFTTDGVNQPGFVACLIVAAVLSKLIGGYYGARLQGLPHHDAQGAAVVMNARGVMEMVVASIAYRAGLVDQSLFATLLVLGMVTTLLTPLLLKWWQSRLPMVITKAAASNSPPV